MDAIIGTDAWRVASVCGIENVAHPISVARRLLESSKEVLLVGPGACAAALGVGAWPLIARRAVRRRQAVCA